MSSASTRATALGRLLSEAATRFAQLDQDPELGARLCDACDRLLEHGREPAVGLAEWRAAVAHWPSLDRTGRAVQVARGMRLLRAGFGVGAARAPARSAASNASALRSPTSVLPGIGPAMAERLAEHSIETVEDLVWLVPRRYDDVRLVVPLAQLDGPEHAGDRVTVRGEVASSRFMRRGRRRWVDVRLRDDARKLTVRFFGAHQSMTARFEVGSSCSLSGKLSIRGGALEMANPDVLEIISPSGERKSDDVRIIPRYRDLQGVPAKTVRKAIRAAVDRGLASVASAVPDPVLDRLGLPTLESALSRLHAPDDELEISEVERLNAQDSPWHQRLAFEELFVLGTVVAKRRLEQRADLGVPCPRARQARNRVLATLPFAPTGAQQRVMDEIAGDLAEPVPMNRLLQGDVGSGKTAVAFAAVAQVAAAGRQVALMAPTEILAEQHLRSLGPWCKAMGVEVALHTASMPRAIKSSTLTLLAAGKIDCVIGTHALLSDDVGFSDLALAIVDEQHRFGVEQRVRLRDKGESGAPHLLVMTATPIPRTLALTAYGDLDVSVIDELPPGREPPTTLVLNGKAGRARAYRELRSRLRSGDRGYLVCPMVEPGEDEVTSGWADTLTASTAIAEKWPEVRACVVHGRMSSDERSEAMDRFRSGQAQLLIATTVIEVGVDVPEATVMLIEDADRFGLSQLHQLRGRVGRGGGEAMCLLTTRGGPSSDGAKRLAVMGETGDGFAIAEADLEIRGPGELLGARQSGLPKLRFGDLARHNQLLRRARKEAEAVLTADPILAMPEHARLRATLEDLEDAAVYGAESG